MKKLTVSIGSLGSATAGDYVDFNIWQGKRLLVSDRIEGRHTGTFYREYDVDYIQGEPLRIESNAPAGCSVCVHAGPSDELFHSRDAAGVLNAVSTDICKLIAKRFVFHHPNGEPVSATGFLGGDDKTLEQRVADLETQLVDTSQAAIANMEALKTSLDNIWMMVSKSPISYDAGITLSVGFRKDDFKFSDNK